MRIMTNEQFVELIDRLKWIQASFINNTVKQVEVACVNHMGRHLTAEEKDVIIKDLLEETAEIRTRIDSFEDELEP